MGTWDGGQTPRFSWENPAHKDSQVGSKLSLSEGLGEISYFFKGLIQVITANPANQEGFCLSQFCFVSDTDTSSVTWISFFFIFSNLYVFLQFTGRFFDEILMSCQLETADMELMQLRAWKKRVGVIQQRP